jgi:hypothetical protein
MTTNDMFQSLQSALCRHPADLAEAKAVLGALGNTSPLTMVERDALVRSLAARRRSSPHPRWPTLLILAFEPALRRLRRRTRWSGAEDLDPMLVEAFLEAVDATSLRSAAFVLSVQRATARKLFQKLRARRTAFLESELGDEATDVPWHREPSAFTRCATHEVLRACARVPGGTEAAFTQAGLIDPPTSGTTSRARRMARDRARQRVERTLSRVRKELADHGG